jgi:hypothetical protein
MEVIVHQLDRATLSECVCGWTMPETSSRIDSWREHITGDGCTERFITRDGVPDRDGVLGIRRLPPEVALIVKAFHGQLVTCHGEGSVR